MNQHKTMSKMLLNHIHFEIDEYELSADWTLLLQMTKILIF